MDEKSKAAKKAVVSEIMDMAKGMMAGKMKKKPAAIAVEVETSSTAPEKEEPGEKEAELDEDTLSKLMQACGLKGE